MAIIEGWFPPTRENFDTIMVYWSFFPILALLQLCVSWYGMGKTSVDSAFNFPGRVGWILMEVPGLMTLLYMMATLPGLNGVNDLPWQNKVLAALFVIHYVYRAIVFPLVAPSMAPIHVFVMLSAVTFQVINGTCLGAWLAAYGPTTAEEWRAQLGVGGIFQFTMGIAIFYLGLAANWYHDEELREIRRREERRRAKMAREDPDLAAKEAGKRHYAIPQAGLFQLVLFPHYLTEWFEWFGYWTAFGWSWNPALLFLVNEVVSMTPRAVRGRQWYVERFGEEKVKGRKAVIPGLL